MSPADFQICAFCPRLCRHVCPVSIATARESATPTAMASVALLFLEGAIDADLARAGTDLCVGCGACTRHCYWHIDVSGTLASFHAGLGLGAEAESRPVVAPAPTEGAARLFTTCWEASTGTDGQLACCGARGGFRETHPEHAHAMATEIVARMAGEAHSCNVSTCAGWLREHGAQIQEVHHVDRQS